MQIFVLGHFPLESSRNGLHGEEKRALFDTRASATYTLSPSTIFSQYIVRDIRPMLAIIENALVKKDKRKRGVQTRMQIGIAALVRTQILHASFHPFLHRPCSLFHNIFTPRSSRHPRVKSKKKKKKTNMQIFVQAFSIEMLENRLHNVLFHAFRRFQIVTVQPHFRSPNEQKHAWGHNRRPCISRVSAV